MNFIAVKSSLLNVIGWDLHTQRLVVQFKNETYGQYDNVPGEVAAGIIFADSPGGVFTAVVKQQPVEYPYKKITAEEAHAPARR